MITPCGAAFYMCITTFYIFIATFCTRKQIHRRAPAGGRLVLAVVGVAVLLQLLSTVSAAKPRPFRDATANVWTEGKPNVQSGPEMAAGPDGSLWVLGGDGSDGCSNRGIHGLFKLELDTKEWPTISKIIEPSAKPCRMEHVMVFVGSDLYMFGGLIAAHAHSQTTLRASRKILILNPESINLCLCTAA